MLHNALDALSEIVARARAQSFALSAQISYGRILSVSVRPDIERGVASRTADAEEG